MDPILAPDHEAQLVELTRWALHEKKTLSIEGAGTKSGFGYTRPFDIHLSMRALRGIMEYEPSELVMTARTGTPLEIIEAELAANGQHLAFEPPDLGGLYGNPRTGSSIGGVFLGNLSGPRRFTAGAARDHILGIRAVSGRAELWKSGGRVIKNVTGYDLSKLLAGSWGTLSVATEITFKVLPAPEHGVTLAMRDLAPAEGLDLLSRLAQSRLDCSGLAYLPAPAAGRFGTRLDTDVPVALARFEGSRTSVDARCRDATALIRPHAAVHRLEGAESAQVWNGIRDIRPLPDEPDCPVILKVGLPPSRAPAALAVLEQDRRTRWYADAGGACLWVGLDENAAIRTVPEVRRILRPSGCSAVLYRAPAALKEKLGLFSSTPDGLAALTRRVKQAFDPENIFNPGRLFAP